MRLVGGVHVAPAFARRELLDALACLVEIAPVLHDCRAERAHRGVLVGVVANGHDDVARDAVSAAGKRDRLAVIAGAGADYAARRSSS